MLVTAKWVLPIDTDPIPDGAILVDEGRIRDVGPEKALRALLGSRPVRQINLSQSVLLPGLVNAHTHLEWSCLPEYPEQGLSFTRWVRDLSAIQTHKTSDGKTSLPITDALQQLIEGGTTTIADHRSPETEIGEIPLREVIFWEVLGAEKIRGLDSFSKALSQVQRRGGFPTPHSFYAVHEEILEQLEQQATRIQSVHLLESREEADFFSRLSGPLAQYVLEKGGTLDFPVSSPIKWLAMNHWFHKRWNLVHGNYIHPEDLHLLPPETTTMIHCPGSHLFFGHAQNPVARFKLRGIPIALGTDSLASNDTLSLFREMQRLKESTSHLSAKEIVEMATRNGARALGLENKIGTLHIGHEADLIAVLHQEIEPDPYQSVLKAQKVNFSMVGGIRLV